MKVDRKTLLPWAVGGVATLVLVIGGGVFIYSRTKRDEKSTRKKNTTNAEPESRKGNDDCVTLLSKFETARADPVVSKEKLKEMFKSASSKCREEFSKYKSEYGDGEEEEGEKKKGKKLGTKRNPNFAGGVPDEEEDSKIDEMGNQTNNEKDNEKNNVKDNEKDKVNAKDIKNNEDDNEKKDNEKGVDKSQEEESKTGKGLKEDSDNKAQQPPSTNVPLRIGKGPESISGSINTDTSSSTNIENTVNKDGNGKPGAPNILNGKKNHQTAKEAAGDTKSASKTTTNVPSDTNSTTSTSSSIRNASSKGRNSKAALTTKENKPPGATHNDLNLNKPPVIETKKDGSSKTSTKTIPTTTMDQAAKNKNGGKNPKLPFTFSTAKLSEATSNISVTAQPTPTETSSEATSSTAQLTPEQHLQASADALLKNVQDANLSAEIIQNVRDFSQNKDLGSLKPLLQSLILPEFAEQKIKLGQEYVKYLKANNIEVPSNLNSTLLNDKKAIIENYDSFKPHLSAETIQELKVASLDLLDPQNESPEEVAILKELLNVEEPSEFDRIRAVSALAGMDSRSMFSRKCLIESYASLWADMSAPFKSLLGAVADSSSLMISHPACKELIKAKTPEEWSSQLDKIVLSVESNDMRELSNLETLFNYKDTQSPYALALKMSRNAQKTQATYIKKKSIERSMMTAIIEGNNVASEGTKVNRELSVLKPLGEYILARDKVLESTTGLQNWTLFNASYILSREVDQSGDKEFLKVLESLVQKDLREADEKDILSFLTYAKKYFHSNRGPICVFLQSRTISRSLLVYDFFDNVLKNLADPDLDLSKLAADMKAVDQVESELVGKFAGLNFAKGIHAFQFFFPFFCTRVSSHFLAATLPSGMRMPSENVLKSQAMIDLRENLTKWYEAALQSINAKGQAAIDINEYYLLERTYLPDVGFFLAKPFFWSNQMNYKSFSGPLYAAFEKLLHEIEDDDPGLYGIMSSHWKKLKSFYDPTLLPTSVPKKVKAPI